MARLQLRKGTKIRYGDGHAQIAAMVGFDVATVRTAAGEFFDVPVSELLADDGTKAVVAVDLKRQEKVPAYYAALKDLLDKRNTRGEVKNAGGKLKISIAAAYAAIARYKLSGKAADLPPPTQNGGRGQPRIDAKVEKIIQEEIEKKLLKRGNHDIDDFIKTVRRRVAAIDLDVSTTTLRERVAKIPPWKWKSRRSGYDEAEKTLAPHIGEHPGAVAPLAQVQCDHWRTDVEILSDDRSTVIGRAWATIAIDIHSRTVWGMYVGLAAPSETTVGLAMINGFLHKEPMLRTFGIETSMPIYGKPKELLLDNAGEFIGGSMQKSVDHFGMDLTWRPVRKPQYGAHIERLNATLARKFKSLPGATGSNIAERKAFRPGTKAAFTLDDLRKQMWLMVDEYNNTPHLGLRGKTPLQAWTDHYFGPNGARRPVPAAWSDDDDLRINWYPLETRSIQRYGIVIDYLQYYNESIEQLVRNHALYRELQVRRHPLDVRRIYLLHPLQNVWCELPCRLLGFPAASLVDLRQAKREALKTTRKPTGAQLRAIIEKRLEHIDEAKRLTRTAARDAARRADEERRRKIEASGMKKTKSAGPAAKQSSPRAPADEARRIPTFEPPEDIGSMLAEVSDADIESMFND